METKKIKILLIDTNVMLPHTLIDNAIEPGYKVNLAPYGEVSEEFGKRLIEEKGKMYVEYNPKSKEQTAIVESPNWKWRDDYKKAEILKEVEDLDPRERELAAEFLSLIDDKGVEGLKVLKGDEVKIYNALMSSKDVKGKVAKLTEQLKADGKLEGAEDIQGEETITQSEFIKTMDNLEKSIGGELKAVTDKEAPKPGAKPEDAAAANNVVAGIGKAQEAITKFFSQAPWKKNN